MPRRATVRPDEPGRERVLEAGLELFGERGYHAVSIADIGRRAGIAKSVLYHHFGSKAGLFEAIAETETRELLEHVSSAVPTDPDEPRLRAGLDAYLGFFAERPAVWRLLLRDPPAESALIAVHERLAAERERALGELLAGSEKLRDERAAAGLTATAIRTFAAWWYEHRDVPQAVVTDAILDVIRAGARLPH
ncbi:MAG TPA: helix-turn-helix domain-containing protein [Thermoleophilaceae bacterium]|nr:helix-turn-helix domain-containing protein [Thermoleophilaceae bacterium]